MTPTHYRNRWLKHLRGYEKLSRVIVRHHLRMTAEQIPFNELTPARYQDVITVAVGVPQMEGMILDIYKRVGLLHGKRIGEGLNRDIKNFSWDDFQQWFEQNLPSWILTGGTLLALSSMRKTFSSYLIFIMEDALDSGMTFQEAVFRLRRAIASRYFYLQGIDRIVATETAGAANFGAAKAAERTGVLTEKMWISATDNRTRRIPRDSFDHLNMHQKTVPENEFFSVPKRGGGFENIRFPGDPQASLGNRINCRCTVGVVPVRNRNGDLVFTDSRSRPARVLAN